MTRVFVMLLLGYCHNVYAKDTMAYTSYFKKVEKNCTISALNFAHRHTQNEWENIKQAGKFKQEVKRICSKVTLASHQVNKTYAFVYEYANDSGKIPSF